MNNGIRLLLVIAILVGLPVASFMLVFRPFNKEIESDKKQIAHQEAMLIRLQEETARNDDLIRANEEVERTVRLIEARLPSNKEVDAIVRQVSDIAVECGLTPPAIKAAKPVPAALYMEAPLEMETDGNYVGFVTFLARVETLPRITRIHDMKLTGNPKEGVELKAEFTLSIYFQDEKKIATAEAAK